MIIKRKNILAIVIIFIIFFASAPITYGALLERTQTNEGDATDFIKTLDEYDEIINSNYSIDKQISGDYELTLLQREFVKNVGYDTLINFVNESTQNRDAISWLMNDAENLCLYLVGGKPEGGSYLNAIEVFSKLYNNYKDDLSNETVTEYGTVLKDLYRKMMFSLSLTHSKTVYLWVDSSQTSDPVTRYAIYKKMHSEGKLDTKIYESLTVEEMRWVMNNIIDDEEIEWLNAYTTSKKSVSPNAYRNPYTYITYGFGYNYSKSEYYDEANYEKWNEKYNLAQYNITYKQGKPKLWIVFEEGGVCGAISKTGSNIWGSYGVPSTVIGQPGHAAYLVYSQNSNGDGIWSIWNDVSGWAQSGRTERIGMRMPNDWGEYNVATYTDKIKPDSYVLLAQAAQNEYEKYEQSEEILLLANVYSDDSKKLEEIYRKAIETESINFDAWYGLVNLYKNDTTKTEADYYKLAEEIAVTYKYYPLPMYDLLRILKPLMPSAEYNMKFTLLQTRTLTAASKATDSDSIQASAVKVVANALLGVENTEIATFSFDGDNAGQIILSSQYDTSNVRWEYSLDNKQTWKQSNDNKVQLTDEELESITAENDIYIHIVGVDYSDDNIYQIDILKANTPTGIYNNDLENKVIGATDVMEWKLNDDDSWNSFKTQLPDLSGDKTIFVRIGATGVYLPSDEVTYNFTEDNQSDTQKYVTISHLSIEGVSSEATSNGELAKNAIDGNINTLWHSNWNGSDADRYIIIKLDTPIYLSKLEHIPRQSGTNGRIKNAQLLVSTDGENWTEVANVTDWANSAGTKTIELDESVNAQYVKLVATENYGDGRNFISATMINLFEDTTKKVEQEPEETPDNSTEQEPEETPDNSTEQEPEETPDNSTEREPVETPDNSTEQEPEETPDNSTEQEPEETPDNNTEQEPVETPDNNTEQEPVETPDNSTEQEPEETPDNSTEQETEETPNNSTEQEQVETPDNSAEQETSKTSDNNTEQKSNQTSENNQKNDNTNNNNGIPTELPYTGRGKAILYITVFFIIMIIFRLIYIIDKEM